MLEARCCCCCCCEAVRAWGVRCRYLAQLLRTTPMEALLGQHVQMSTEIKTLDSDMQVPPCAVGGWAQASERCSPGCLRPDKQYVCMYMCFGLSLDVFWVSSVLSARWRLTDGT